MPDHRRDDPEQREEEARPRREEEPESEEGEEESARPAEGDGFEPMGPRPAQLPWEP